MRFAGSALLVLALLGSVGCHESSTVAGSFGERALQGKVVPVGDLQGASAAGIDVRAGGVIARTDASGAFVLSGLPDSDIIVVFDRPSDRVHATLAVGSSEDALTVELQSNRASTRKHGVRASSVSFKGNIVSIGSSSITVLDKKMKTNVTCLVVQATRFASRNGQTSFADLRSGMGVEVKATANPDGTYTADEIELKAGGSR